MDFKKSLMALLFAATVMSASATELISNETWANIVNIMPWIALIVVGIVGIFFVILPLLIVLKVIGFLGNFLDKMIHLIDKAL